MDFRFAFSHNAFIEINNLVKYYECDTVKVEPVEAAKYAFDFCCVLFSFFE